MADRDYYCNNKFKFLKIDLEKRLTYNCHAAAPHRIDIEWLEKHPGEIFNTDVSVSERSMMLKNIRNSSCEQNCWRAEDVGAVGPRIIEKGYLRTHTEIRTQPEIVDLTIGSECNLTCSYCCGEFSSAWVNDLQKNGEYTGLNPTRYSIRPIDLVLRRNSQPEKVNSKYYQTILEEFGNLSKHVKKLIITGGEPFLNNYLFDILERTRDIPTVKLFCGLGVSKSRFEKIIERLKDHPNIYLCVSIENTGKFYEFNRYGNQWSDVVDKINLIKDSGITMTTHSTLGNLTIFGYPEFYRQFKDFGKNEFDLAHMPEFMPVSVIDPESKKQLIDEITELDIPKSELIIKSLQSEPTKEQHTQLKSFLSQFTARRSDLDINIFPKSFLEWINNDVV